MLVCCIFATTVFNAVIPAGGNDGVSGLMDNLGSFVLLPGWRLLMPNPES